MPDLKKGKKIMTSRKNKSVETDRNFIHVIKLMDQEFIITHIYILKYFKHMYIFSILKKVKHESDKVKNESDLKKQSLMHVQGRRYMGNLYLLLDIAVNLKLF